MSNRDPHNLKPRLEAIADVLFTRIEAEPDKFENRELLQTIQIVGMWLTREVKLANDSDSTIAGSAVRKYAPAFAAAHAASGRKSGARPRIVRSDPDGDDAA